MLTNAVAFIFLVLSFFFVLTPVNSDQAEITTLRVVLYPYVPDRLALFQKIEEVFESSNPGVNLELIDDQDLLWGYYSGALQDTVADVYEVDTILLSDLVESRKISPIELPEVSFTREAIDAVTRKGVVYGVPHWLCGNFLFYKKGDKEIENAKSWKDLTNVFETRKESLFIDLKGKSTLGEWYLTVLSDYYGLDQAQKNIIKSKQLDQKVITSLTSILKSCPAGYCRSDDLHDRPGYYSRAFISGQSDGYVGYSESIYYGIQYFINNCTETSGCLSIEDISVRRLPVFSEESENEGIGWVDAFTIDSKISSDKRKLAMKFIEFMVSEEAYKLVLEPEWGQAPSYLIPAVKGINIGNAPLYKSFYEAHIGRETGTSVGLNDKLRSIGKELNCQLPISRTDYSTLKECNR